tara:strand:- start:85 stop:1362 length:1278 start_codon:yes stop_codon:yes gene_type:complete
MENKRREIQCPNCQKKFELDEKSFADIIKQVRDKKFEEEINSKIQLLEKEKNMSIELEKSNLRNLLQNQLAKKDEEINHIKSKINQDITNTINEKDKEISEIKSKLNQAEIEKKLAISEATKKIEKENHKLSHQIQNKDKEKVIMQQSLINEHLTEIKNRDGMIAHLKEEIINIKEMRQKLSTKMLGESLEQHCEVEFNKLRPTAFQNAIFEKDNKTSDRTKGDYIYREVDENGNEIISIMFEMKNESDNGINKKKNSDFFEKLDKDREKKSCEYAILVSVLESNSELYNQGIVDVSYKYKKMYVIRPQFFIPIITILRNAAMKSLKEKAELARIKNQNIDITNFESKLIKFKEGFSKNYLSASNNFQKAIEEIDKSIARMEAVKKALKTSENQLRLANSKADEISIKKLTHNNPTMKRKFEEGA